MSKFTQILFLIIIVSFTGCYLYLPLYYESGPSKELQIEILRPADTIINPKLRNVLIFIKPGLVPSVALESNQQTRLDNIVFENPPEPGIHSLKDYVDRKFVDLADIEFRSMADLLSGSPRFELMVPDIPIEPTSDSLYSWKEIDSICAQAGSDACLVLNTQNVIFKIKVEKKKIEYEKVSLNSKYQLYIPSSKTIVSKEVRTILNFNLDPSENQDLLELLYREGPDSLVSDFSRENGEKLAVWLAPCWQLVTRSYFLTGNMEMESVNGLIKAEEWPQVYQIWRRNLSYSSTIMADHAYYNSILSYEMEGKLDSALNIAKIGYARFGSQDIIDYENILEDRIKEDSLVKLQLGENY